VTPPLPSAKHSAVSRNAGSHLPAAFQIVSALPRATLANPEILLKEYEYLITVERRLGGGGNVTGENLTLTLSPAGFRIVGLDPSEQPRVTLPRNGGGQPKLCTTSLDYYTSADC